jgi:ParB/RepB/Spo0J family partition protein
MPELTRLDIIQPNPYQPRQTIDQEHIIQLAESIRQLGLLQPPMGRRIEGDLVQLAFGHSRLAAYKLLAEASPDKYGTMPVEIRELSNEEMARIAITENLARKDLNALEQAQAMKRYRDEFGKTSEQIGELFGMSDAAVRNKMRLLELPAKIQSFMANGSMHEGAARELLRLYSLPQEILDKAELQYSPDTKPSGIEAAACNGGLASHIKKCIDDLVNHYSTDLCKAPWKHDETILASESGAPCDFGPCKGCEYRRQAGEKVICLSFNCYLAKQKAWEWRYTRLAAWALGYLPIELEWDGYQSLSDFSGFDGYGGSSNKAMNAAITAKCPNLRVAFGKSYGCSSLESKGMPEAHLICQMRHGFCTCHQAVNAKVEITKKADEQPITAKDLEGIAREARQAKKSNFAACRRIQDQATRIIQDALFSGQEAMRLVLNHMSWQFRDKQMTHEEVMWEIARLVTGGICEVGKYNEPDPEHVAKTYNQVLEKMGLPSVSVETEA